LTSELIRPINVTSANEVLFIGSNLAASRREWYFVYCRDLVLTKKAWERTQKIAILKQLQTS